MSCQSHLHISPQSLFLQEFPHSWRLERPHLVRGLQGELDYLDEVLLGGADGRLLVADEVQQQSEPIMTIKVILKF